MIRVKICCIASLAEAELVKKHGADAIGLVSWMPSGTGMISDDRIREIAGANADVRRFLLTCKTGPDEIVAQIRAACTDTVQLVDRMATSDLVRLREELPDVELVQVVHVTGPAAIEDAQRVEPFVDSILLDSGTPDASVRRLGGTGETHDWDVSAELVRRVGCPVFLAGGLGPDNVVEAIDRVRPYGVDVCSRLRPHAELDADLLERFMRAVRGVAGD
jgi:phosphoribosylanthranilate isomerase